jgi:hypothetical protein
MGSLMDEHTMTDSRTNNQANRPAKPLVGDVKPQSVARLLGVTLNAERGEERDGDEGMAELLAARLAETWLAEDGKQGAWSKLRRQLLRKNGPDMPRPIGGLLLDSHAPLGTIRSIRDRAKARTARESSETERAAMTMIYFAAIANALVHRGAKITTYAVESLESSFEKLIRKSWMPVEFVGLFRQAAKVCREERSRLGSQPHGSVPQS